MPYFQHLKYNKEKAWFGKKLSGFFFYYSSEPVTIQKKKKISKLKWIYANKKLLFFSAALDEGSVLEIFFQF